MANSSISCNSGSYTIVGSPSSVAKSLGVASGSYAITGTAAGTRRGFVLAANIGSYSLVGALINVRRITAAPAGYLIDGQAVTLTRGTPTKVIAAASGSYAIAGQVVHFIKSVPVSIGAYALTGTVANLTRSAGTNKSMPAASGSYAVSGTVATFLNTIPISTGDYQIVGGVTTLRHGWSAQIVSGVYGITAGPPVKLAQSRHFPSASGTYGLTGQVVVLTRSTSTSKVMTGDTTPYFLTGQVANLLMARRISAVSGSYAITGKSINPKSTVLAGGYILTGTPVSFHQNRRLIALSGTYSITGGITDVRKLGKNIAAANAPYVIAGFQATLRPNRILTAVPGFYLVTGIDANLAATHIGATTGVYTYIGTNATLTASRSGRWRKSPKRPMATVRQPNVTSTWDTQPPEPGI